MSTVQQDAGKRNAKDISAALTERLDAVLLHLLPNGRKVGNEYCVGSLAGEAGNSLKVNLNGKRGVWSDFATGASGGDLLDLWKDVRCGGDIGRAMKEAADFLGLGKQKERTARPLGKPTASWTYRHANGDPYYEIRRYDFDDGKKEFRPYNLTTKEWKFPKPRLLYDLHALSDPELIDGVVNFFEGEKCCEAAKSKGLPLCTTTAGGAGSPHCSDFGPLRGRDVFIFPDNDEAGQGYAEAVATLCLAVGVQPFICPVPENKPLGWDIADAVAEGWTLDEIEHLREQAQPYNQMGEDEDEEASGLPVIVVNNQHLRDLIDESLDALRDRNTPPLLFERSGVLVRVHRDERNRPFLDPVSEPVLRESLTRSADFVKESEKRRIRVSPPRDVVQTMHARGSWQLPALVGLCECPVLRPDGTVLDRPGYDEATRLFYDPAPGLTISALSATPTQAQAQAAAEYLRSELLIDFPFCADADKANMFACILTPIVRPAIKGCVPLCLIDKPGPGSGATLLSDVAATIPTGLHAAKEMMPAGRNSEEEMRKRITSLLMAAKDVVVLDNIDNALASSALSAVLTTPLWQDRVLSKNEIITLPVRSTWIATANNIAIRGDIARRSYRVRIDPKQDRPWTRDGFKHADLLAWTREHRGELLHALLTMARAWFAAEKPKPQVKPQKIGGFEEWVSIIGGILAYAGVEGFLGNLEELYSMVDEDAQQWRVFIATWHEHLGEKPVTVAEYAGFASTNPALMEALPDVIDWDTEKFESSKKKLGKALKKRIDRHFDEYRLEQDRDDTHTKVSRWRVKKSGVCGV